MVEHREDISKDLRRKIVNDAAAYVGELAREHDRNVVAARKMVTEAANYGARDAKAIGLVEVIAPTLPALLNRVDGMKTVPKGLVLETAGAQIESVEMSFWQRARDFLVDPNLIALMLSIGLIGIVVELWNPGLIFPGTVGAISLILGLYGLQVLPVSLAGLLLMILAAAFFVAEAFVPTHTRGQASDGLGLTISRQLARLMGGDLTYRREGGMTVFRLVLPGRPARSRRATRPSSSERSTEPATGSRRATGRLRSVMTTLSPWRTRSMSALRVFRACEMVALFITPL